MKLDNVIKKLYKEREGLDRLIGDLRQIQASTAVAAERVKVSKRRGRKSMNDAERRQVAERMKKYWAGRRMKNVEAEASQSGPVAQVMHF